MSVIKIKDTKAEATYKGNGNSLLVCNSNIPEKIIYLESDHENEIELNLMAIFLSNNLDLNDFHENGKSLYYGMCSPSEFFIINKIV